MTYVGMVLLGIALFVVLEVTLSKLHGEMVSSTDFPTTDHYFAYLERRDRFFWHEYYGGCIAITAILFVATWWFTGAFVGAAVLALVIGALGTLALTPI